MPGVLVYGREIVMGSVNVFEWFKYRTFYASQFARTSALVKEKNRLKLRISLGIPTLNEEKNIGRLVRKLR
ncbi:MAG: hypothetical protein Q7R47_06530 [Candidatus Diapherotrites archaeon]|nr:hypothetical protein [Candidatus Diapherotrites archaeon]